MIQKTGIVNKYTRKVFKWIISSQSTLFLFIVVAFLNYWSVFYIAAFIREAVTNSSEKYAMNYLLQAFFYGWIVSILLLFCHCLFLKYMLIHRKIKSAVIFLFLHVGYFLCLVIILIFV